VFLLACDDSKTAAGFHGFYPFGTMLDELCAKIS
jgi:hypothetical protein